MPLGTEEYYVSNQIPIPLSRMPGSTPAILPAATPNTYEKLHSIENADSVGVRRHSSRNSGKSRGMLFRPFGRRRILCGGGDLSLYSLCLLCPIPIEPVTSTGDWQGIWFQLNSLRVCTLCSQVCVCEMAGPVVRPFFFLLIHVEKLVRAEQSLAEIGQGLQFGRGFRGGLCVFVLTPWQDTLARQAPRQVPRLCAP